jgi:endonuclease YncB( thermonuclease family)
MPLQRSPSIPRSYAALQRRVEAEWVAGRARMERAWVAMYHETGRLIHEHLMLQQERAEYGARVIADLAAHLRTDRSTLHRCVRFARLFPIVADRRQLGWAHYRVLIDIDDPVLRNKLAIEAERKRWTSPELESRVRALNAAAEPAAEPSHNGAGTPENRLAPHVSLLTPRRGTIGVHRVVAGDDAELAVDFGFTSYVDLAPAEAEGLAIGAFVRLDTRGRMHADPAATKADLYTYRAKILRVVDGDTLWLAVRLGPRQWLKEKLRLRGLDCPEIATPEGRAAKRFVEALAARAAAVTICTTKPDKYDRYLSDVFLAPAAGENGENGGGNGAGIFLNNALLENGHAVRKDTYSLRDWDETPAAVPG